MRDVNGKEILPGQRVRWTQVREAEVEQLGSIHPGVYLEGAFFSLDARGTSIEVLSEPRIEEPTTLGTVVTGQCPAYYTAAGCSIVLANPNAAREKWWCATHCRWNWWGDIEEPRLEEVSDEGRLGA